MGSSLQHVGSSLWHAGSLVAACGIKFPDQGSNPGPLHGEHGVLTSGPPGKSFNSIFFLNCTFGVKSKNLLPSPIF